MVLIETSTKLEGVAAWEAAIATLQRCRDDMTAREYRVLMAMMQHGLALARLPVPESEGAGSIRALLTKQAQNARARALPAELT